MVRSVAAPAPVARASTFCPFIASFGSSSLRFQALHALRRPWLSLSGTSALGSAAAVAPACRGETLRVGSPSHVLDHPCLGRGLLGRFPTRLAVALDGPSPSQLARPQATRPRPCPRPIAPTASIWLPCGLPRPPVPLPAATLPDLPRSPPARPVVAAATTPPSRLPAMTREWDDGDSRCKRRYDDRRKVPRPSPDAQHREDELRHELHELRRVGGRRAVPTAGAVPTLLLPPPATGGCVAARSPPARAAAATPPILRGPAAVSSLPSSATHR